MFTCVLEKLEKVVFILRADLMVHMKPIIPLYLFEISIFKCRVEGIIAKVSDPRSLTGLPWNPLKKPRGSEDPVYKQLKRICYIYILAYSSGASLHGQLCPCLC